MKYIKSFLFSCLSDISSQKKYHLGEKIPTFNYNILENILKLIAIFNFLFK